MNQSDIIRIMETYGRVKPDTLSEVRNRVSKRLGNEPVPVIVRLINDHRLSVCSGLGCSEDDAIRKLYGSFEQMILSYVEYVERDGKAW